MKCKNCQFWEEHNYARGQIVHECVFPDWCEYNEVPTIDGFNIYADAADITGLSAGIITGPEFGCLKFKSKKER